MDFGWKGACVSNNEDREISEKNYFSCYNHTNAGTSTLPDLHVYVIGVWVDGFVSALGETHLVGA